jgi:hypothetical protein
MDVRVDWSGPHGPWRYAQPRYEKLLYRGPGRFFAQTRLPSGRRIAVRLACVTLDIQPQAPRRP